jgi:hypothetical protein
LSQRKNRGKNPRDFLVRYDKLFAAAANDLGNGNILVQQEVILTVSGFIGTRTRAQQGDSKQRQKCFIQHKLLLLLVGIKQKHYNRCVGIFQLFII